MIEPSVHTNTRFPLPIGAVVIGCTAVVDVVSDQLVESAVEPLNARTQSPVEVCAATSQVVPPRATVL